MDKQNSEIKTINTVINVTHIFVFINNGLLFFNPQHKTTLTTTIAKKINVFKFVHNIINIILNRYLL